MAANVLNNDINVAATPLFSIPQNTYLRNNPTGIHADDGSDMYLMKNKSNKIL